MRVGVKLGVGVAAGVVAGSALSLGAVAGAVEPPPKPGQEGAAPVRPQAPQGAHEEEGRGPGGIFVGAEGHAKALGRLEHRASRRAPWFCGKVAISELPIREGPGRGYEQVRLLKRNDRVKTDWGSITRNQGYLWVQLQDGYWIADYILYAGTGKWYVDYGRHPQPC